MRKHFGFYPFCGETRPLTGGIICRRLPDKNGSPKPGTIGYVATTNGTNQKVLLSCDHVFIFSRNDDRIIFQPDYSKCAGFYYHNVGKAIKGFSGNRTFGTDKYFIDAALASIDDQDDAVRAIPNVGHITGAGNIIDAAVGPTDPVMIVKKMGAMSHYTEGIVRSVNEQLGPAKNFIRIDPSPGHTFTYKEKRKIDLEFLDDVLADYPAQSSGGTATLINAAEGIVEFKVEVFALPGDSGAQVINSAGEIVGMVFAGDMFEAPAFDYDTKRWRTVGIPKGPVFACHIQPVLEAMDIHLEASTITTSAQPLDMNSTDNGQRSHQTLNKKLARLEHRLNNTIEGRELVNAMQQFFPELVALIHHNREIKVAWHRLQGPAFIALFFRSIDYPDMVYPRKLKDVDVIFLLQKMATLLRSHGSPELRIALEKHTPIILEVVDTSPTLQDIIISLESYDTLFA